MEILLTANRQPIVKVFIFQEKVKKEGRGQLDVTLWTTL